MVGECKKVVLIILLYVQVSRSLDVLTVPLRIDLPLASAVDLHFFVDHLVKVDPERLGDAIERDQHVGALGARDHHVVLIGVPVVEFVQHVAEFPVFLLHALEGQLGSRRAERIFLPRGDSLLIFGHCSNSGG